MQGKILKILEVNIRRERWRPNRQTFLAPPPGARLEIKLNRGTFTWNYRLGPAEEAACNEEGQKRRGTGRKGEVARGAGPPHGQRRGAEGTPAEGGVSLSDRGTPGGLRAKAPGREHRPPTPPACNGGAPGCQGDWNQAVTNHSFAFVWGIFYLKKKEKGKKTQSTGFSFAAAPPRF